MAVDKQSSIEAESPDTKALRQALARMEVILKGADLGTWHWTVATDRCVFDARWAEMLGYRLDELEPHRRTWEKLVHPDDLDTVRAALETHLAGKSTLYDCEHRLRHKDGHWVWVLTRGRVVERDAAGRPLAVTGTHLDITARRQAEEKLRQSEERFRAFINHSPSYIFAKDLEGRYILANRAYLDLFGFAGESELMGRTDAERFGGDVDWTANDRRVLETGEPLEFDETARFPDGERIYISAKFPLRDAEGAIVAVGGISTDITARKRAEEGRALLMREVDHRAKNVLAGVQALVMLMQEETVPAFKEALLGRIHAMARAHTLLATNRWTGGDLGRLIREELEGWEGRVTAEGPSVSLDADIVQALALALHELAANAAKYGALSAETGSVAVTWALGGPGVRIVWTETGGPPVSPPTRRGVGTALMTQGIESQLGGTIRFDWRPEGLRCEIEVPTRVAEGAP